MKKVFFNLTVSIFLLINLNISTSCNHADLTLDNKSNYTKFTVTEFQNLYENHASSVGKKFNATVKEVKVGLPPKNIIDFVKINNKNLTVDFDNTIIVKIVPNQSGLGLRTASDLNTYVIAIDGTNNYITVAEYQQEVISATLSMTSYSNGSVGVGDVGDVQELSWGKKWFKCMKGIFDDEFTGVLINTLGVAGGAGCGPCGIAAGVIVGVGALGCMG